MEMAMMHSGALSCAKLHSDQHPCTNTFSTGQMPFRLPKALKVNQLSFLSYSLMQWQSSGWPLLICMNMQNCGWTLQLSCCILARQ